MGVYKAKEGKTKDGRIWFFKLRYQDMDGRNKQYKSGKYATKKEAEEDGEPYEEIDLEPCITLSCGYPKCGRDVTLNLEEIINAITEKDGVVEKIKKEIESGE